MKGIASLLASQGRHGDTELVHMSKPEVAALRGLAGIAGRKLTTNPKTGLPEAFSLQDLLPTIAGMVVGTIATPVAGAAVAGGLEAVKSGDPMRGLMTGLMSYGGGQMLGSMGNTVEQPLGDVVSQTAGEQIPLGDLGTQTVQRAGNLNGTDGQFWNNIGDKLNAGDFSNINKSSAYAAGIGGLGMANYWAQDAAKQNALGVQEDKDRKAEEQKKRVAAVMDLARRFNQGMVTPPSFPLNG